ncbi:anchored repeat ABC transporter, substrate-binding protein [Blastococcus haudaquaticus]|uniref:anchored repeat ABC transporter, substrate-binding protein n=1 Tax=Blastococcus haudaquaticus TaxID=1938745 RepID=UPI00190E69E6|nr:anchored repeat ABC transporter, substrate-binding protein [Blastococcus haudaquaticus]
MPLTSLPAHSSRKRAARTAACLLAAGLVAGCATPGLSAHDDRVQVVTTTGILADLAAHVGGDRIRVTSLVPDGADPHSYEPSLRRIRDVAYADVAFSNYMMLEQHAIVKALDANLRPGVPNVSLAEGAVAYAAEIISLVENVSLDTIWLGLRVAGSGEQHAATRASDVLLSATGMEGPGDLVGYLTGSFGEPEVFLDSSDGFDAASGYRDDTAVLPPDAHSHMSWAFTEPGVYRLTLSARLAPDPTSRPVDVGEATYTFAVGIDPHGVRGMADATVLDGGHADLSVDLDRSALTVHADPGSGSHGTHAHDLDPAETVIAVPNKALQEVPAGPGFRFLGRPGTQLYQLPQAVLGKHVHGEIDPHLWHDVRNAMAYVELIRDTLTEVDPAGARTYRDNAEAYLTELDGLDHEMTEILADIPLGSRHLITTHDAFAYLARAYGLEIAGFVTPNPATEPSLADRRRLAQTIRNLDVPAVFLEPNLAARSSTLTEIAGELGVEVCALYGDTFDDDVRDYVELMRFNARSLHDCLTLTSPSAEEGQ